MSTFRAPGKIILFGEHAVVYGRPALAVPVMQVGAVVGCRPLFSTDVVNGWERMNGLGQRITTDGTDKRIIADGTDKRITTDGTDKRIIADERITGAGETWERDVWVDAPDIEVSGPLAALRAEPSAQALVEVITRVIQFLNVSPPPLRIQIASSIPVASGLGSGAAVAVALIRSLAGALGCGLDDEQVNALAYEIEKLHHGTPSGIDNTVITYARPVYFVRGQPIETFRVGAPFTLVIGDTGISAPTRESVGDVRALWQADPNRWESVFEQVADVVRAAKQAIESGNPRELGPLMAENQALLQAMSVSSPALDALVAAAISAGALGAKLSGGGRGGNMIALVEKENAPAVAEALLQAGAKRTIVTEVA